MTITNVTNGLFELIRSTLVVDGKCPDILLFRPTGIKAQTLSAVGIGYKSNDILSVSGGAYLAKIRITSVDILGAVTSYLVIDVGTGYSVEDNVICTGGAGDGFQINITEVYTEAQAIAAYNTALEAIQYPVVVKGMSTPELKGRKVVSSISISYKGFENGSIGGKYTYYFTSSTQTPGPETVYHKYENASPENLVYEIRTVAQLEHDDTYLSTLIGKLLYGFKYLDALDDNGSSTGDVFLVNYKGCSDVTTFNLVERLYKFVIIDAQVIPDRFVGDTPAILDIQTTVKDSNNNILAQI